MERHFLLVDQAVLPEVFQRVVKAKELLANGTAQNTSDAIRQAQLSRASFYKYKDSVFDAKNDRDVVTVMATLLDETGALHNLLAGISAAGASIVTINQSAPENGTARVAVSIRTTSMQMPLGDLLERIRRQRTVVDAHQGI